MISLKANASSLTNRDILPSVTETRRQNVLASQGKYTLVNPITNLDNPLNYGHNAGVVGNKSMTEYLYRRAKNTGIQPSANRGYEL